MNIVVLTGAGISAESGIKTFRAADGLWEEHRIEDVASPEGFGRDPELVHRFYNKRRRQLLNDGIEANAGHRALARLEQLMAEKNVGDFCLVTQNIDNLHEQAGSRNILHMHGELLRAYCLYCQHDVECMGDLNIDDSCGQCGKQGGMRPDIVWFGEIPKYMDDIATKLMQADLFVAIGTSGHVYPAAGFVQMAREGGADTLEINLEPSQVQSSFHRHIYAPATESVPVWVDELCQGF